MLEKMTKIKMQIKIINKYHFQYQLFQKPDTIEK
jgi:hypothetical protein